MFRYVLVVVACAMVFGCSSSQTINKQPVEWNAQTEEYKVGAGDSLSVLVWKSPEFSVSVPVRPDGFISVPLVGDVLAKGESAKSLADKIAVQLQKFVRNPQVTVTLLDTSSTEYQQRVRVTGAVSQPLSLQYKQGMTVLDLVLQAGGLTQYAQGNRAQLYRKVNDSVEVYPVNIEDILYDGNIKSNYLLAPSDILTIPERSF